MHVLDLQFIISSILVFILLIVSYFEAIKLVHCETFNERILNVYFCKYCMFMINVGCIIRRTRTMNVMIL